MNNYVCKIANVEDVALKYDYEIEHAEDKDNWIVWKENAINRVKNNDVIVYHGVLDGEIICEATAALDSKSVQNSEELINKNTVYLFAFRTNLPYRGLGYFSKLFHYMIDDLKSKGYKYATVGVEPKEKKNFEIYQKWGFTKFIKSSEEEYPNGEKVVVNYYAKEL